MPLPVSATLISAYISHSTTDTVIFPPAGVYFTALSSKFLRCIHNPTHSLRHGIKEAAQFLIQLDHARFQPGGFHKGLKEKVQLIRLAADSTDIK